MAFTTRRRKKTQQSRPLRGPSSYGCFAARFGFYHAMFPGGNNPSCWREFFSPRPRSLKLKWKRGFRRFLAKCKPAIAKRNKTHADIVASRTDAFVEPASWRNNIDLSVPQAHQRVSDNNEFMIFCPYSLVVNLGRFAPAPWVTMVGLVDAIFV
jgi:hypothetical protein